MITILTPSFNRVETLPRLYKSLMEQTCNEFEWLIIDDGSTDQTEELIYNFSSKASFTINYYRKENGGKHSALNMGFMKANEKWIFIVDSDDWLKKDCIRKVTNMIKELPSDYHSISILKQYNNDDIVGDYFKNGLNTYLDRIYSGVKGDKADIFKVSSLKGFSFPEYENENFMAESPLFIWLGQKGKTKFINYSGYICEYQDKGLSQMSIKNRYRCINSTLYVYENQYINLKKYTLKYRAAINWWRFKLKHPLKNIKSKVPFIFAPFGMILFIRDFLKKDIF